MKSLLVFTALLAVGLAEESKAPVVVANPYLYGYPGYGYYGHGAPLLMEDIMLHMLPQLQFQ